MNYSNLRRLKKLQNMIDSKDSIELLEYDILINGTSILPCPLRPYQKVFFDNFVHGKTNKKKAYLSWSRRSGKSFTVFIALVYLCLRDKNTNAYQLFPQQNMVDRIIWSGVFIDKLKSLSYKFIKLLPFSICTPNNTTKTLNFNNGSTLKFIGTADPDDLRGITSGLMGVSEYSFCKEYLLKVITPIIVASNGRLVLETTPNGRNFAFRQFNTFKKNPSWFCDLQTCDTLLDENGNRYITQEDIDDAVSNGLSKGLIRQEFYCDPVLDEDKINIR